MLSKRGPREQVWKVFRDYRERIEDTLNTVNPSLIAAVLTLAWVTAAVSPSTIDADPPTSPTP